MLPAEKVNTSLLSSVAILSTTKRIVASSEMCMYVYVI